MKKLFILLSITLILIIFFSTHRVTINVVIERRQDIAEATSNENTAFILKQMSHINSDIQDLQFDMSDIADRVSTLERQMRSSSRANDGTISDLENRLGSLEYDIMDIKRALP